MQLKCTHILSIFKILNIDHQCLDIELSSLCMQKMLLQLFFYQFIEVLFERGGGAKQRNHANHFFKHWVGLFF